MATTTITVATTAELYAALAQCTGGETVLLKGGNYAALDIHQYMKPPVNMDWPSTVTIASANPADPAVFPAVKVTGASNLTFDGVTFDYTFKAGDPVWVQPFNFRDCDGLVIKNSTFDGDLASGTGRSADDGYGYGRALSITNSRDVVVEGNEVFDFYLGMSVSKSSDVVVRGNELYDLRSDGMMFAQMDKIFIEGNHIHDFRTSPTSTDHPDMIQFFTQGTTAPSSNIVIRDNILDIGNGTATQTIWMRNEMVDAGQASFAAMAYRNVLIENNTITNAHLWGISVGEAIGVTIRQNSVLHADGRNADGANSAVEIPSISVKSTSTGVSVTGNVTSAISGWSNQSGWTVANNAFVQDQNPSAPGYYGNVFVGSSLQPGADGSHHYVALTGSMIDTLNAGSQAIQPGSSIIQPQPQQPQQPQSLQLLFQVDEADAATRVFDASMSTRGGTALPSGTTYLWSFGDGTTGSGRQVAHSYADGGDYNVTLTVVLPDGIKATQALATAIDGPEILMMDSSCRFTAYENGASIALGQAKTATADGLQLGAPGVAATVARTHVVDVAGTDDMTIAFSLDADKAGSWGELFRLHGSFVTSVTKAGELQVAIMRDGAPTLTCVTNGARLNKVAEQDHDIVIHLDNGQLQLWVDGKLGGQMAVPGVVGGTSGFNSHGLAFGNPWGHANFNGDISAFELSVGAGDFPSAPVTQAIAKSVMEPDLELASSLDASVPFTREMPHTADGREMLGTEPDPNLGDSTQALSYDRYSALLEARLDAFSA